MVWFAEDGHIFAQSLIMNCSEQHILSLDLFRHEINFVATQLKMLIFHMEIETNACKGPL